MTSFAEHSVCAHRDDVARAGIETLERGGNAVDAAVAMGFASGVVDPVNATLAGSGYMVGVDAGGCDAWTVEFPARAPRRARPDMYEVVAESGGHGAIGVSTVRDRANAVGHRAATVPAAVAGLCGALEAHGRLPLPTVLGPAIELAREGFEVDAYYALFAAAAEHDLRRSRPAANVLLGAGRPPVGRFNLSVSGRPGPRIVQRALAELLETIAERGPGHVHGGPAGNQIADEVQSGGGLLTAEDLADYACLHARPLRVRTGETELLLPVSPAGGWTVHALCRLWSALVPAAQDLLGDERSAHLAAEGARHAFADRYRFHGDPDHADVPLAGLLSDEYLGDVARQVGATAEVAFAFDGQAPWDHYARRAIHDPARFDASRAAPGAARPQAGSAAGTASGTTHFCAVDADRLTVSCTMTVGEAFGSRVLLGGSGLLLDSGMLWFNALPGFANSIAPWKRPLANMAPLVMRGRDGRVAALGASGGRRIVSAVAQVARRVGEQGMGVQEAIDRPRFDASGARLLVSSRVAEPVLSGLAERGHDVAAVDERASAYDYEFARPLGLAWSPRGRIEGGAHASMPGYVLGR